MAPQYVEQYLISRRIESWGGGVIVRGTRSKRDFADALESLLREARFRGRAAEFAAKYRGFDPDQVTRKAISVIDELLDARKASAARAGWGDESLPV
jgi:O-acetyl-ADP-ribose deacetylase (regulator of RNase III)